MSQETNPPNPPAQSVLADLVTLAPNTRALVDSIQLPADDPSWVQLKRAFLRCLAWVEFWKAEGSCPEVGLKDATIKVQLEATSLDASVLSSEKLIFKYPEQQPVLQTLQRQGEVFSKGWAVILWEVSG